MKRTKTIIGVVLTLLYVVGLVFMFMRQMGIGLSLWVISTVGGIFFLWYTRQKADSDDASRPE